MLGKSYTCHNCPQGRGKHCARCRRVDQDDIRIQHSPHNRAELQAAAIHPASEQATTLPADIEDTLRRFLFDLFDLDPIQLMLLRHVKQGGTPTTFGRVFAAFLKSSIIYGKRKQKARWERTCQEIGAWISGAKRYYLQAFTDRDTVPFGGFHAPGAEKMQKCLDQVRAFVGTAEIRGMEL